MASNYSVRIQDGPHVYEATSPSKDTIIEYLSWWMQGVRGSADVAIRFLQEETPANQATLDEPYARESAMVHPLS